MTTPQKPVNATHWSSRSMAAEAGVSEASVRRVWKAHGLKPHRVDSFKLSNDPRFTEKLEDIVGLYLNPPWYFRWTRRARFRHWTAPNRDCP